MIDVIGIDSSTSLISPSTALLNYACRELETAEYSSAIVQLRKLPADDLLSGHCYPLAIRRTIHQIRTASGLIISASSRHAVLSGALSLYLQLLPEGILEGKVVLPIITESASDHACRVDQMLRPALNALKAKTLLPTVYVNDNEVKFDHGRVYIGATPQAALSNQLHNFMGELHSIARAYSINSLSALSFSHHSTLLDQGIPA